MEMMCLANWPINPFQDQDAVEFVSLKQKPSMRKAAQPVGDHLETAAAPFHLFLEFMWRPFSFPKVIQKQSACSLFHIPTSMLFREVGWVRKKQTSKLSVVELLQVLNMQRQPQSMLGDTATTAQSG